MESGSARTITDTPRTALPSPLALPRSLAFLGAALSVFLSCLPAGADSPTWRAVIEGRDWGPAVTTLIVGPFGKEGSSAPMPETVSVKARREDMKDFEDCSVTGSFPCGAEGDADSSGRYLRVSLETGFDYRELVPMIYESGRGLNRFADIRFEVRIGSRVKITRESPLGSRWLLAEEFGHIPAFRYQDEDFGSIELTGAFRTATGRTRSAGEKRPLVIWLHGAGEGGTDPWIVLLGNRVVNLATPAIQGFFGGADILAPQCPTFWMDSGRGFYTATGSSKYARALMALIRSHLESRPETDLSRIYLGGCSNGGFMTVKLIADNPGVFAAGWPVCGAFFAAWLTPSQTESLAATPLWFTHAKNDTVVPASLTSVAVTERLLKAGAADVRLSLFPEVLGEDGEPYLGHFSWIYALKNECVAEDGLTLMEWLAAQRR